jgi:hypothetical protein
MISGYGANHLYYYIFTSCGGNQLIYGYPKSDNYYYPRVYVQANNFEENLIRNVLKSFTFEKEYPEIVADDDKDQDDQNDNDDNDNNNDDQDDNPNDKPKETKTCYQFYGNFSLDVPEDWNCESPEEKNAPADKISNSLEQREYLIATNGQDKIEVVNKKFEEREKIFLSCNHRDLLKNKRKAFGGSNYYRTIVTSCEGQVIIYGYGKFNYQFHPRIFVQTNDYKDKTLKKILKSITFLGRYPQE